MCCATGWPSPTKPRPRKKPVRRLFRRFSMSCPFHDLACDASECKVSGDHLHGDHLRAVVVVLGDGESGDSIARVGFRFRADVDSRPCALVLRLAFHQGMADAGFRTGAFRYWMLACIPPLYVAT